MKKVLVVIGTRPEAIKLAPVVHAMRNSPGDFETRVCLTGQHQEMLYQALSNFDVSFDYDLKLMKPGQTLSQITAAIVEALQTVVDEFQPDIILVQGDTTTAFVGSLVGFYNKIKIGHVEAGLRTDDKYAPFPEEMNRRLVSCITDYHFAPTTKASMALIREGVDPETVVVTGNTVIDALFYTMDRNSQDISEIDSLKTVLDSGNQILLVTGHRRENFGEGFLNICRAIKQIAATYPDLRIIYPVHLNPNVQKPVYELLADLDNVYLIAPVSYVPFVKLLDSAHIVLTDSGGVQEEAPSLGKPVLVMREVTERQEAVEAGTAILVGTDRDKIVSEVTRLLTNREDWEKMSQTENPFGDGKAANRIVDFLRVQN